MSPCSDRGEIVPADGSIRCLLVHDHVLLRQGLRRLLEDEPDINVVGEAGNAAECLRKVHELRPDIVVADAGGLLVPEVELRVARESPQTKVVFLSALEETISRFGGLPAATAGCAVRHTSVEELVQMVRSSCWGDRVHHREAFPEDIPQDLTETQFPRRRALTAREEEVMKLLAEGNTVRAAATVLGLSVKTVDAHKFNLMRKLGIHNKAQLVMWAIQKKVVKVPVNF